MTHSSSWYRVTGWCVSFVFPLCCCASLLHPLFSWSGTVCFVILGLMDALAPALCVTTSPLWTPAQQRILRQMPRVYILLMWGGVLLWAVMPPKQESVSNALGVWMNLVWMVALGVDKAHENQHRACSGTRHPLDWLGSWHPYRCLVQDHISVHHNPLMSTTREDAAASSAFQESYYTFLGKAHLVHEMHARWMQLGSASRIVVWGAVATVMVCAPVLCGILLALAAGVFLGAGPLYAQHYGLRRIVKTSRGRYAFFEPSDTTWDSTHVVSQMAFLNFPCHIHHHEEASLPFYDLMHRHQHPQQLLPLGYFAICVIAPWPQLWFQIMNGPVEDRLRLTPHVGSCDVPAASA